MSCWLLCVEVLPICVYIVVGFLMCKWDVECPVIVLYQEGSVLVLIFLHYILCVNGMNTPCILGVLVPCPFIAFIRIYNYFFTPKTKNMVMFKTLLQKRRRPEGCG